MASCKDCLYVEVCRMHYRQKCKLTYDSEKQVNYAMKRAEEGNPVCDHFKDRSRFVEVSCKVGDRVYYIANVNGKDKINSAVVQKVTIHFENKVGYDCGIGEIGFSNRSIGKRVFLTKEQAEQALKEQDSE